MKLVNSIVLMTLGATGCASYIETVKVNPDTLQVEGPGVQGVIYYEAQLVKVRYEFTQLVDKDKGLIGSSDLGTCKRAIQKDDILTLPNYKAPRAVLHKPSWFSSSEFGVTLNNGMLVSVTSKSTPQTPQLLEQIPPLKLALATLRDKDTVADCNSGPIITRREVFTF